MTRLNKIEYGGLHNLYISSNSITITNLRSKRLADRVVRMREMRNT
jgi:hypothetical protein